MTYNEIIEEINSIGMYMVENNIPDEDFEVHIDSSSYEILIEEAKKYSNLSSTLGYRSFSFHGAGGTYRIIVKHDFPPNTVTIRGVSMWDVWADEEIEKHFLQEEPIWRRFFS